MSHVSPAQAILLAKNHHDDDVYILTRTCVKCTALLTTHGAKKYAEMFLFSFVCAKYKSYCLYGKHRKWLISENYHHKK